LEDSWALVADTSVWDKLGIFLKLLKALQFCHEKGVFHRNISADVVRVTSDCSDVRLVGFDCALDLAGTSTTNKAALSRRDSHLIPPEDLQAGRTTNPRLSDIFQTGLLLYRILENGSWPFDDTFEYVTSGGVLRPFSEPAKDQETEILRTTAVRMLDLQPGNRPDLLSKVEQELHRLLS
jgi:serine/threonine protein kinase